MWNRYKTKINWKDKPINSNPKEISDSEYTQLLPDIMKYQNILSEIKKKHETQDMTKIFFLNDDNKSYKFVTSIKDNQKYGKTLKNSKSLADIIKESEEIIKSLIQKPAEDITSPDIKKITILENNINNINKYQNNASKEQQIQQNNPINQENNLSTLDLDQPNEQPDEQIINNFNKQNPFNAAIIEPDLPTNKVIKDNKQKESEDNLVNLTDMFDENSKFNKNTDKLVRENKSTDLADMFDENSKFNKNTDKLVQEHKSTDLADMFDENSKFNKNTNKLVQENKSTDLTDTLDKNSTFDKNNDKLTQENEATDLTDTLDKNSTFEKENKPENFTNILNENSTFSKNTNELVQESKLTDLPNSTKQKNTQISQNEALRKILIKGECFKVYKDPENHRKGIYSPKSLIKHDEEKNIPGNKITIKSDNSIEIDSDIKIRANKLLEATKQKGGVITEKNSQNKVEIKQNGKHTSYDMTLDLNAQTKPSINLNHNAKVTFDEKGEICLAIQDEKHKEQLFNKYKNCSFNGKKINELNIVLLKTEKNQEISTSFEQKNTSTQSQDINPNLLPENKAKHIGTTLFKDTEMSPDTSIQSHTSTPIHKTPDNLRGR